MCIHPHNCELHNIISDLLRELVEIGYYRPNIAHYGIVVTDTLERVDLFNVGKQLLYLVCGHLYR